MLGLSFFSLLNEALTFCSFSLVREHVLVNDLNCFVRPESDYLLPFVNYIRGFMDSI